MDILKRINDLRNEKQWTIYKLSEISGVTQSTLSNMFTRQTLPSITTLTQLCEAFNITLSEFFSEGQLQTDETFVISKYRELSENNKAVVKDLINCMLKNK